MKKFKKGFVMSDRLKETVDNMDSSECASPYNRSGIEEEIRRVRMVSRMWWCFIRHNHFVVRSKDRTSKGQSQFCPKRREMICHYTLKTE